ncbi:MAG TPA: Tex family protein [Phycisphaerae bacterium]|nr:Tex family protein [Phycisphaerae bacterium]HPS52571.1 Tex family protein [Phycisphaerae bacterium]
MEVLELANYFRKIALEQSINPSQVQSVAELFAEGGTVPFIARYRKERTGGLDEVNIIAIRDRLDQLQELDKRRQAILKSIQEQGKLTGELEAKIQAAETMNILEDIYLPYKPKRRTRGTMAKDKGLEPLALLLLEQNPATDPLAEAQKYISTEKDREVPDVAAALAGARDIIAENISENAAARAELRKLYEKNSVMSSKVLKGKEEDAIKYSDYFEWAEPAAGAPSHRILAIRRGAKEGFLTFHIQPDEQQAIDILFRMFVKGNSAAAMQVQAAAEDSFKRLLSLSMETEMRLEMKNRAEEEAIRVFADNIRELLLASPLGQQSVLALDPGFRTGCKLVCLDPQGKLLFDDVIYLHKEDEAEMKIRVLAEKFRIQAIAIGNGTAGRETKAFCDKIDFGRPLPVVMVNESGASVYSASEVARDEFPDKDVTVRGSVSIGRRLMDPLAELVKIDPKSIGVGQYQHDVDQKKLKNSLDDVVTSCVNSVGVEINTASKQLLSHVAGLSEKIAAAIVETRNENGPFTDRREILKVAGMGPKTFEQAAGFLRIRSGNNPLDASAVHPESYPIVERIAADLGCTVGDLMANDELRKKIDLKKYVTDSIGLPTLNDILQELAKPGRDPREPFQLFSFADGIKEMTDLKIGQKLPGVVTNVTNFGAFVDIGVHQDGLVHISELADRFVEKPSDVVKVHQKVEVTVTSIDIDRKRIGLSMRSKPDTSGEGRTQRTSPAAKHHDNTNPQERRDNKKPSRHENDSNNPFKDFFKNYKI